MPKSSQVLNMGEGLAYAKKMSGPLGGYSPELDKWMMKEEFHC